MPSNLNAFEDKMKKTISVLESEMKAIRAGRANPGILDKVSVEYYGAPSPLTQIANVSVPDARTILVQPWDASILGEIEKAILKSDIGITPNNDGKSIRLNFPPLTEERRKEIVKGKSKGGEEGKRGLLFLGFVFVFVLFLKCLLLILGNGHTVA